MCSKIVFLYKEHTLILISTKRLVNVQHCHALTNQYFLNSLNMWSLLPRKRYLQEVQKGRPLAEDDAL